MSKEIYISSTPHETRLAIVENDELTEIYYERENEYTLAGSIYNGRVTRVLPGMQSSFVDIGLERDAFLYITDFMEEAADTADFDHGDAQKAPRTIEGQRGEGQRDVQRGDGQRNGRSDRGGDRGADRGGERNGQYVSERSQEQASATPSSDIAQASEGRGEEFGNRNDRGNDRGGRNRGRGRRDRGGDRQGAERNGGVETPRFTQTAPESADAFEDLPIAPVGFEGQPEIPVADAGVAGVGEGAPGADGSRRWRGRRGRRRGRGTGAKVEGQAVEGTPVVPETEFAGPDAVESDDEFDEVPSFDIDGSAEVVAPVAAAVETVAPVDNQPRVEGGRRERGERGGRNDRGRGDRGDRNQGAPRVPRGFAPRGQYVADAAAQQEETVSIAATEEAASAIEPLILPGESLGKYRKGGEETPAPKASAATIALPDSGFTVAPGWDGGLLLPGETLSRHRGGAAPASSASEGRGGERADFRNPEGGRGGRDRGGRDRSGRDQGGRDQGGRGGRDDQRGGRDQRPGGRQRETVQAAPGTMAVPSTVPGPDLQSSGPASGYAHASEGTEEILTHKQDFTHAELPQATAEAPHALSQGEGVQFNNESDKPIEFIDAAQIDAAQTDHAQTDHAQTDHAQTDHAQTDHAQTDHAATPEPEQEYEPKEASASYRVDPVAPSEYRQSAPAVAEMEEPLEHHEAHVEVAPSGEVFPDKAYQASEHDHAGIVGSVEAYAETLAPEPEVEAEFTHEPVVPEHEVTVIEPTGEMVSEAAPFYAEDEDVQNMEEAAETSHATGAHLLPHGIVAIPTIYGDEARGFAEASLVEAEPVAHQPAMQHFEPGLGDLEEDFIEEEEEFETHSLQGRAEEFAETDIDSEEQEPLEGTADLGTMIREMSIDHITRADGALADDFEDEDDFEEDTLEEDEFEEAGFEPSSDEEAGDEPEETRSFADSEQNEEHSFNADRDFQQTPESDSSYVAGETRAASTEGGASPNGNVDPRRRREGGRRGGRDRDRGSRDRGGNREQAPRSEAAPRSEGSNGYAERSGPDRSGLGERARNTGGGGDRDRGGRSGGGRGGRQSMQMTNLPAISELLKPGQEILCQIAKEPIAKKGARITSHIALPGRFLVFMPTVSHTGVSRKIESDAERRRLKEILLSEKGEAAGGFIVRTAAAGASEEELRSDLRFLLNLWTDIKQRSESSKSPALIYHDLNLVERILRDQVTDNFSAIWVDTETEYERVLRFLQRFQPQLIRRVKLYTKETPLFEQFGITEEINKALRSKVWLKSGGSIVINQTEALVAIDINTGKFVGKTARLEDTIVKTNLDAIPEIVRQIRLRDLGGIIIIDFIDMDERKNRNRVMAALEEELKTDRAPSKVLPFNDFGLVAITRKRVKQSLERTLSTTCNVCTGTGMVKSPVTVCNDIYIEMRKMHKHLDRGDVMLRVHPEVVKQLKLTGAKWLQEMEEMCGKTILIKSDPSLHPEQFDIH